MINQRMKELGETRSVIRELFEYGKTLANERGRENVFDFSLGNPSAPVPACVTESVAAHLKEENIHNYTSAQGDLSVRRKIAEYSNAAWQTGLTADDIYLTTGAAAAISIVFRAINAGGGEFIAVAPFFPEYRVFAESAGGTLVPVRAGEDFSLDVPALAAAVTEKTVGVIINSPNNPVGNVYTREEIAALADALRRKEAEFGHPIYLVSDEPYREITYGAEVVNPMNFYDDVVICYSFSKTLSLAGERIGYIAVSPRAAERRALYAAVCGAGRALGYVCAPSLFQKVIADCLGKTADLSLYRTNRDLLYGMLTELGFECVRPQGAFYLFVKCPCDPRFFFETCKEEGVLVVPSDSFGVPGYVRIAYCVPTDVIVRAGPHFSSIAKKCGL